MAKYPQVDHGICRFAVLHHTGVDESHYDFMFETSPDSPLITFRLPRWPALGDQPAIKLRDHRRAYLTFEGSIPGDRGQVMRVDEGSLHVIETPTGWALNHPDGAPLALLEPQATGQPDRWQFLLLPSNPSPA